ncbi:ubiquitin-conjugating enzyme E2-binding protein [Aspergillus avenaceus]|uniref:Ubiquitin-conjugating enzyme E2-binding protein n=1 Tax=Aspergillus avenaceus TaxID=36643 RepID=A0A5N6THW6_ASPAV|nr:ubiquitin-conjugating enzyme E2-binding protein [Aspergillus avenaceus]
MSTDQQQDQPALYLHAELLPNIRHITLHISFATAAQPADIRPEICLSDSCRAITVSLPPLYDNGTETIKLPARVNEASQRMLNMAVQRNGNATYQGGRQREYSFRMQVDDARDALLSREEHFDSFVPWTATEMASYTRLCCRHCKNVILRAPMSSDTGDAREEPRGWEWKDLPSGNWAEMMDFWHCHKPDPRQDDDHNADASAARFHEDQNDTVKGYGAANQVIATPGTVLVDVATFLVAYADCNGLKQVGQKILGDSTDGRMVLRCEQCNSLLGIEDTVSKGYKLFKTSVSASKQMPKDQSEDPWESHPLETVVAAQLLELIERESARRFIIHCGQKDGLMLWVFNPDLRYSNASSDHSITAQRAMKILFQDSVNVDEMLHPESGKASSLSLEELRLPVDTYDAILQENFENGRLALCIGMNA